MMRISPVVVLLVAAGCANAGIGDWFSNPFKSIGGNKGHGSSVAHAPAGTSHSPKSSGHRGSRQLHPSHGGGGHYHGPSHNHYGHAPPAPLLGSLPGSLDDGFKPSFPPGFANPPSYSPNLNPFATLAGHGSEAIAKGPFLPSQLTVYHTPKVDPGHASAPLTRPVPLPSNLGNNNRGRSFFGGNGGRSNRGPRHGVPPHGAVSSGNAIPDGTGPVNPDGSPVSYDQFPGLASEIAAQDQPEYEETPTTPPQAAPQGPRGPRGPFSFMSRFRHRPAGPSHHHNHGGSGRHFGRRPQHQQSGPPGGPPQGGQQGHDGSFNIDGSGPEGQNPFGNGPSFGNDGPQGNPFGDDGPPQQNPFGNGGPQQNPFGNDGPQQNPFGNDGPQQNPFGNNEPTQNLFGGGGPLNGGPGQLNSGSPLAGPQLGGNSRPGGRDVFFATSPGSSTPFAPVIPEQGPGGPSPFNNPQGPPQFNRGQRPGGLFGRGQNNAPQGPPRGPGGPNNGPQSFFGPNGDDYPEQFGGGQRGARNPNQQSTSDYRPQPNGPPDAPNDEGGQSPGFYGALHNSDNNPQLSSFFGNSGPQNGPEGQGGPSNGQSPFGNTGGNPYGNTIQAHGEGGPGFSNNPHNNHGPGQQQRKPPMRFGFRNPLAGIFQGSSSALSSHNNNNLAMSASTPAVAHPVPKGSRLLRPFLKKQPGSIIPLSSPKDPNYHPLRLGSSLSPISAPFEPETAASGGYGGYGNVGLSHNGDRILYHVGNHKGPHSYQFGYDTGKGHNRIFRFEEKDGHGFVKGKYGFYDKHGKLNIINYMAHPKHGYHAERGHSHGHY